MAEQNLKAGDRVIVLFPREDGPDVCRGPFVLGAGLSAGPAIFSCKGKQSNNREGTKRARAFLFEPAPAQKSKAKK